MNDPVFGFALAAIKPDGTPTASLSNDDETPFKTIEEATTYLAAYGGAAPGVLVYVVRLEPVGEITA